MGRGGSAGRLIKRSQRACGAQLKTARLLALCDGDSGKEGLLRSCQTRRGRLVHDLAADTVQDGIGAAFSGLACERQRCVDPGQRLSRLFFLGFYFGEQTLENREIQLVSQFGVGGDRAAKLHGAARTIAEPSTCPTAAQSPESEKERESVFLAQSNDSFRNAPGGLRIATKNLEESLKIGGVDQRRNMSAFDRARNPLFHQLPRSGYLTHHATGVSEIDRCAGGRIREAEAGLTIALAIENAQRLLEMRLSGRKIALAEAGQAQEAPGYRLCDPFLMVRSSNEGLGHLASYPQLAAQKRAEPQPVIGGESLRGIVDASRKFLSTGEGGLRFDGAVASRPHECLAVACLQLKPAA